MYLGDGDMRVLNPCDDGIHAYEYHTPARNMKTCPRCTDVQEMTAQECWTHRESFEDPSWKQLGGS